MSTLIIAEKPNVGLKLAKYVGATTRENGFYSGNGYVVSWAIGHLVDLAKPSHYSDNPWSLDSLPIIPERFALTAKQSTKAQFKILQKLIKEADVIINAADAAREGELIFRRILEVTQHSNKSIKRLWVSSYTPEELAKAFGALVDQSAYEGLYLAGKARSEIDWIYGMNATIGYTLSTKSNSVKSLGRVQTPTYCMVTKRFIANRDFKSEATFNAFIILEKDEIIFKAYHKDTLKDKSRCQTIISLTAESVQAKQAEKKKKAVVPPKLFDLTSLQIEANNKYGLTAKQTLTATQELYEKKGMVTYPRTDSSYLNKSQKTDVKKLLEFLKEKYPQHSKYLEKDIRTESFDDSKVTDHHAIIPTNIGDLKELSGDLEKVFKLILLRTLANFSKNALKASLYYLFDSNDQQYEIKETVYLENNWRELLVDTTSKESKLPQVQLGEVLPIKGKQIKEGTTQAPAILTDASLITMMNNCGKDFEDDIESAIKKDGIGTVGTRDSIIERIIEVGYIYREKKKLMPTELGLSLYPQISKMAIANVTLTGNIEKGLSMIEQGKITYDSFMNTIKTKAFPLVFNQVINAKAIRMDQETLKCPVCSKNSLVTYSSVYVCEACRLELPRVFLRKSIGKDVLKKIISGDDIFVKGFFSKSKNKKFDAYLLIDKKEKRYALKFKETEKPKILELLCPVCAEKLSDRKTFISCSGYNKGCTFSLSKVISGHILTISEIKMLVAGEKTEVLNLVSRKNKSKKFKAKLFIKDGKLVYEM